MQAPPLGNGGGALQLAEGGEGTNGGAQPPPPMAPPPPPEAGDEAAAAAAPLGGGDAAAPLQDPEGQDHGVGAGADAGGADNEEGETLGGGGAAVAEPYTPFARVLWTEQHATALREIAKKRFLRRGVPRETTTGTPVNWANLIPAVAWPAIEQAGLTRSWRPPTSAFRLFIADVVNARIPLKWHVKTDIGCNKRKFQWCGQCGAPLLQSLPWHKETRGCVARWTELRARWEADPPPPVTDEVANQFAPQAEPALEADVMGTHGGHVTVAGPQAGHPVMQACHAMFQAGYERLDRAQRDSVAHKVAQGIAALPRRQDTGMHLSVTGQGNYDSARIARAAKRRAYALQTRDMTREVECKELDYELQRAVSDGFATAIHEALATFSQHAVDNLFHFLPCVLRVNKGVRRGPSERKHVRVQLAEAMGKMNAKQPIVNGLDMHMGDVRERTKLTEEQRREATGRAVEKKVREGRVAAALTRALSAGVAGITPAVLRQIRTKTPVVATIEVPPGEQTQQGVAKAALLAAARVAMDNAKAQNTRVGRDVDRSKWCTRPSTMRKLLRGLRPTAAGPDGISVAMLRMVGKHPAKAPIHEEMGRLFACIRAGTVSTEFRNHWMMAQSVPLHKKEPVEGEEPEVRPIAVTSLLKRAFDRWFFRSARDTFVVASGERQLVNTRDGTDVGAEFARSFFEDEGAEGGPEGKQVVLQVDVSNAYNSLDRPAMLALLRSVLPDGVYRYVSLLYAGPGKLDGRRQLDPLPTTLVVAGTCETKSGWGIPITTGVLQGCCIGAAAFGVVIGAIVDHLVAWAKAKWGDDAVQIAAYADDMMIACPEGRAAEVHERAAELLLGYGLRVNGAKCVAGIRGADELGPDLQALGYRLEGQMTKILGIPIGDDAKVREELDAQLAKLEADLTAVLVTPAVTTEARYQMVRLCLHARLRFLLRSVGQAHALELGARVDVLFARAMLNIADMFEGEYRDMKAASLFCLSPMAPATRAQDVTGKDLTATIAEGLASGDMPTDGIEGDVAKFVEARVRRLAGWAMVPLGAGGLGLDSLEAWCRTAGFERECAIRPRLPGLGVRTDAEGRATPRGDRGTETARAAFCVTELHAAANMVLDPMTGLPRFDAAAPWCKRDDKGAPLREQPVEMDEGDLRRFYENAVWPKRQATEDDGEGSVDAKTVTRRARLEVRLATAKALIPKAGTATHQAFVQRTDAQSAATTWLTNAADTPAGMDMGMSDFAFQLGVRRIASVGSHSGLLLAGALCPGCAMGTTTYRYDFRRTAEAAEIGIVPKGTQPGTTGTIHLLPEDEHTVQCGCRLTGYHIYGHDRVQEAFDCAAINAGGKVKRERFFTTSRARYDSLYSFPTSAQYVMVDATRPSAFTVRARKIKSDAATPTVKPKSACQPTHVTTLVASFERRGQMHKQIGDMIATRKAQRSQAQASKRTKGSKESGIWDADLYLLGPAGDDASRGVGYAVRLAEAEKRTKYDKCEVRPEVTGAKFEPLAVDTTGYLGNGAKRVLARMAEATVVRHTRLEKVSGVEAISDKAITQRAFRRYVGWVQKARVQAWGDAVQATHTCLMQHRTLRAQPMAVNFLTAVGGAAF